MYPKLAISMFFTKQVNENLNNYTKPEARARKASEALITAVETYVLPITGKYMQSTFI